MNLLNFFSTSSINFREVLKYLPDAVFVVEVDGKISWVNNRAVRMFRCFDSDLIENQVDEVLEEGFILVEESFYKKKSIVTGAIAPDGSEFFVELSASKFGDQYFVTLRDATKMTGVFDNVENTGKMNKEKNFMLYKLSNEFKSPMQMIEGFSAALKDGLCGEINEKQQKYLEIINKNSKELSIFMEKFLDFSYAESTMFRPEIRPFDVIFVIQSILKDFEALAITKKIELDLSSENLKKKLVYSDEKAFKSILSNLVEMAISMTETGGVHIMASNPNLDEMGNYDITDYDNFNEISYLKLEIRDTGVGFGANEMKTLCDPYSLLDSSNRKAIQNSIIFDTVRLMVKKLKGDFKIESEVMKGSRYTIVLPIEKDKE